MQQNLLVVFQWHLATSLDSGRLAEPCGYFWTHLHMARLGASLSHFVQVVDQSWTIVTEVGDSLKHGLSLVLRP